MSSQYTTSLKIQEIGTGDQSGTWGNTTNTNWTLIEQAVAGVQTITMSNANYTLSNLNGVSDEARNMVLVVTGTNNTIYQVIAPLVPKMYVVTNNTSGGNAITIGASTGSVITIPNGTTAQVYCDGSTGFYSAQTGSAGNFTVNGNLTVTGNQADVGSFSAASISVSGAATFATSPTAPTPTTGDNTTKVATTAFVQSATSGLGTMATQNANAVAITGGSINGTTIGGSATAAINGTTITASNQFTGPGTGLTGTASSLTAGSANSVGLGQFGASLTPNGYQKLPSGLILQWGSLSGTNGNTTITFPIAFPTACVSFTYCTNLGGSVFYQSGASQGIVSLSTTSAVAWMGGSTQYWMAIGY